MSLELFTLDDEDGKPCCLGIYLTDDNIKTLKSDRTITIDPEYTRTNLSIIICHRDNKDRLNASMKNMIDVKKKIAEFTKETGKQE